jgi:hypothetical protein
MKLRYKGGNVEKVQVRVSGKPRNQTVEKEKDQLTQTCEGVEYHFPEKGAVLSVPPNVGGWLLYKCGKFLEPLDDEPAEESTAPNRIVAVVPKAAEAPAKPATPPATPPAK